MIMKIIFAAAVLIGVSGGAYAADFDTLAVKATGLKALAATEGVSVPAISKGCMKPVEPATQVERGSISDGKFTTAEEKKMNILGYALTKLSASVEATVRYENPPKGLSDMELLILSTSHDPGLMAPFADYTLRVSRQDRDAVVLVCDKDGKYGLLEDAGCSGRMDKHLWKETPPKPCEFTVDTRKVCQ